MAVESRNGSSHGRRGEHDGEADGVEWQRLLWKEQPFPDNYVPPSFLDKLQTNATIVLPSYGTLVVWSLPITQQVASILAFVGVFAHLLNGTISALTLVLASSATVFIGWIVFEIVVPDTTMEQTPHGGVIPAKRTTAQRIRQGANAILSLALLSLVLLALSPVLRTLTEATTSDSIWALSVGLFALNAALADYSSAGRSTWMTARPGGLEDDVAERARAATAAAASREDHSLSGGVDATGLTSALSLNAAICASVVLGSRLRNNLDVFALVLCAVHIFALLPLASVRLRACELAIVPVEAKAATATASRPVQTTRALAQDSSHPILRASLPILYSRHPHLVGQVVLTLLLVALSLLTLWPLSKSAALLSLVALAFISVGCPAWMRWAQRWKRELKGPWDPAVPRVWTRPLQ